MNTANSVFVVTDGLYNHPATANLLDLNNNTSLSNVVLTTTGNNYLQDLCISPNTFTTHPTYNEFWQFDESFDLMWKSFFDANSIFKPIKEKIINHPCDIQETDNGLRIEIAAVGLDKDELDIITDSETLRIAHRKTEDENKAEKDEYRYLHRSIKKSNFDIAWKISSKYELAKLDAKLEKGLLTLDIPFAKENKPKKVTIK